MIRLRLDLFAESLGMGTSVVALLPQPASGIGMAGAQEVSPPGDEDGPPVLYLLHGLSDDCTVWGRRTSLERYVAETGIAVVMPEVRRSFYCDEVAGEKYWTYVSEELPQLVSRSLRVSTAREHTFVAGLSMGGYGAMKLALHHPDRYAAAASFSGALDLTALDLGGQMSTMIPRIWGDQPIAGTGDDLVDLVSRADPERMPALFLDCGTEDVLLPTQRSFVAAAQERGVQLDVRERPGAHEWGFWDRSVQDLLAWLPIRP